MKIKESLDRCIDCHHITEIMLKTPSDNIQSIGLYSVIKAFTLFKNSTSLQSDLASTLCAKAPYYLLDVLVVETYFFSCV